MMGSATTYGPINEQKNEQICTRVDVRPQFQDEACHQWRGGLNRSWGPREFLFIFPGKFHLFCCRWKFHRYFNLKIRSATDL